MISSGEFGFYSLHIQLLAETLQVRLWRYEGGIMRNFLCNAMKNEFDITSAMLFLHIVLMMLVY